MASTPSGSALTAVLRCRRNVWARNTPSKRPSPAGYSLGLAGALVREASTEWSPSWGGRMRGLLAVDLTPHILEGNEQTPTRLKDYFSKLRSHGADDSHGDMLRHLARKVLSSFAGADRHPYVIRVITHPTHVCKAVIVQEVCEQSSESRGSGSCFAPRGWSTLRDTCLSLTTLLSDVMFRKLAGLCLPSRWRHHTSQQQQHGSTQHMTQSREQAHGDPNSSKRRPGQKTTVETSD